MRSANLMGKPCKRPRRCADTEERVYTRVKYIWRRSRARQEREREFGCEMSQTSAPRWCNCIRPAAQCSRSFMKWTKPFTLRLHAEVKCGHVVCKPEEEVIPFLKAHDESSIQNRSVSTHPFYAVRKALLCYWYNVRCYAFTRTKQAWRRRHMAWCPVIPDPRGCPDAKKKTPHALISPESAERERCPADLARCLCERGRADVEEGGWSGDIISYTRNARAELKLKQLMT